MNPLQRFSYVFLGLFTLSCWAAETDVEGRWLSGDGDGWVEVQVTADGLIGVLVGSPNAKPGDAPRHDDKNPDPKLRDHPLNGMTVMSGLSYDGDSRWSSGTIYNPNSGKTYKCTLTQIDDNTIKIRGYIGISLFGRSEIWTRDDK